jgi:hypothetical protein
MGVGTSNFVIRWINFLTMVSFVSFPLSLFVHLYFDLNFRARFDATLLTGPSAFYFLLFFWRC